MSSGMSHVADPRYGCTSGARWARTAALIGMFVGSAVAASCKKSSQDNTVSVLYAGSLATALENGLGAAFSKATGHAYKGEAQGSLGAARMIHDHLRSPDVFISADPTVNETVLMGDKNGKLVSWYSTMAASQLVLAYNPKSPFADKFKAAAAGTIPWYEVLQIPGVHFGRGDPSTDPKGYRTLFLFDLAGKHYRKPEIPAMLGDPMNPAQVFPEIVLLARVESGQFDAGIFYKHEIVAHHLPFITFPPEINLGDPKFARFYAEATYQLPSGDRVTGAPIIFTITIPRTVSHPAAAEAFVRFMLSSPKLLEGFGFTTIEHQVGGDREQIPAGLRELCPGTYKP
jgi:molybdate/tungstate transport system substrate-binding protein